MSQAPVSTKKSDGGHIKGAAAVPNVVEVRWSQLLPNQKIIYCTVHGSFAGTAPNIQSVASALFTSIGSAWSSNLASFMHTTTQYTNVFCRDMTDPHNPVFVGTGTAIAGTSASGVAMPVNAAIVMTENIAARGKGMKGRVFLGGWAQNADAGNGLIAGTVQTAINAFGTALANALNAQSLSPCVAQVHRQAYTGVTGTSHLDRPANHVAVTTYTCANLIWDTQRRRIQL